MTQFSYALALCLLLLSCQSSQQADIQCKLPLPFDYKLDGAVSYLEELDTSLMELVYTDHRLMIKSGPDYYYLAVRSDTATILNAYIFSPNKVKVMHASGALGETNFTKEVNTWVKDRSRWDWRYRDTVIWGRYHKKDYMHAQPIQDFGDYYCTFKWVANTISFGSRREMEMVVSKDLVQDLSDLRVTYTIAGEDKVELVTGPAFAIGLTATDSINEIIHEGALPLLPDTLPAHFFQE